MVVEHAVSAGALDTARYEPSRHADAGRHARMLLYKGRVAMVKRYLPPVEEGERALVFIADAFSRAVREGPVLTESGVIDEGRIPHPDVTSHHPTDEEINVVSAARAVVPSSESPLFVRVDLALDGGRHRSSRCASMGRRHDGRCRRGLDSSRGEVSSHCSFRRLTGRGFATCR
ncbi:hypothetical protein ACGFT2_23710 [Streptomyces sp. NPDC048514]|uniref:hypothetical protein n=1 Tax=Streptomyces sp. NPDC048514 TaxID=3365564 RepID=UPI003722CBA4